MKRSLICSTVLGLFVIGGLCSSVFAQKSLTAEVTGDEDSVTGTVTGSAGSATVTISRGSDKDGTSGINPATGKAVDSVLPPPDSFGSVQLGMTVDTVKQELLKDRRFGYRGERDVSLLSGENRVLIETDAARYSTSPYLDRCWFQFVDDKLYVMTINMNQEKLDHYSVFSSMCEKYGAPTKLDPQKAEWVSDSVIVDLERPLCLKYTDKNVYEKILSASRVDETVSEQNRQQFLEGL